MKRFGCDISNNLKPLVIVTLLVVLMTGCAQQKPAEPRLKPYPGTTGYVPEKSDKPIPKPYRVNGKWYQPLAHARGFKEQGIASWYGDQFHGKPTSSGEIYDMHKITAAHKILPFNTYVRVYNLENDKSLDVRINDRGPFVPGRIIDLSYAAAKALGIVESGTAEVRIIALGTAKQTDTKYGKVRSYTPVDYYSGKFSIQVGAFADETNAQRLASRLKQTYKFVHVSPAYSHTDGSRMHRVLVGRTRSLETAEKYEKIMRKKGFPNAFIVAE